MWEGPQILVWLTLFFPKINSKCGFRCNMGAFPLSACRVLVAFSHQGMSIQKAKKIKKQYKGTPIDMFVFDIFCCWCSFCENDHYRETDSLWSQRKVCRKKLRKVSCSEWIHLGMFILWNVVLSMLIIGKIQVYINWWPLATNRGPYKWWRKSKLIRLALLGLLVLWHLYAADAFMGQ